MEAILEPDGYQFVKASSGRHALKILLTEFDFALILMDVKMPNLSGFETAALIYEREKLRHIPIIFITANNFGEDNTYSKATVPGPWIISTNPSIPTCCGPRYPYYIDLYQKEQAAADTGAEAESHQ